MTTDQLLAQAWLAGWDAGRVGKTICPFTGSCQNMWQRGRAAGCRNQRPDQLTMGRFVALSIGLNREMPDER